MSSAHRLKATSIRDHQHRRPGDPVQCHASQQSRQDVIRLAPVIHAMGFIRRKPLEDVRPSDSRFPLSRGPIEAGEAPRAGHLVGTSASWPRAMVGM
jgi:hypothetical protein